MSKANKKSKNSWIGFLVLLVLILSLVSVRGYVTYCRMVNAMDVDRNIILFQNKLLIKDFESAYSLLQNQISRENGERQAHEKPEHNNISPALFDMYWIAASQSPKSNFDFISEIIIAPSLYKNWYGSLIGLFNRKEKVFLHSALPVMNLSENIFVKEPEMLTDIYIRLIIYAHNVQKNQANTRAIFTYIENESQLPKDEKENVLVNYYYVLGLNDELIEFTREICSDLKTPYSRAHQKAYGIYIHAVKIRDGHEKAKQVFNEAILNGYITDMEMIVHLEKLYD